MGGECLCGLSMNIINVRLQFGNGLAALGYREVVGRDSVVIARLIGEGADGRDILLHEGAFRTRRTLQRTATSIASAVADWPVRASKGTLPSLPKSLQGAREDEGVQRANLPLRLREGLNIVQLLGSLLFIVEEWNVGIIDASVEDVLRDGLESYPVQWLPASPTGDIYADPFGVEDDDGTLHIIFEAYRHDLGRAELVQTTLTPDGVVSDIRPFVDLCYHMSFPFLLKREDGLFCVPETHDFGCVQAFPMTRGQDGFVAGPPEVLLHDTRLTDPIVFAHEGRWWLMGSDAEGLNLFAWHGTSAKGPWTPHKANPIKSDVRAARPAGPVFSIGDKLLRPAQDGSQTYGGAVVINRIMTLTPDHFEEEVYARITPDPNGPYPDGLHSFIPVGRRILIDGKKSKFHPTAFLRRFVSKGN